MMEVFGVVCGIIIAALFIVPMCLRSRIKILEIHRDCWEPCYQKRIEILEERLEWERKNASWWQASSVRSSDLAMSWMNENDILRRKLRSKRKRRELWGNPN